MAKAAWLFAKNDNGTPKLPLGVTGGFVNSLQVHTITGGPVGFEHTHLLVGGLALRSLDRKGEADEHHTHLVAWYHDVYHQVTENATSHQHVLTLDANGVLSPDWFLIFWKGDDSDAALIQADTECIVACQAVGEYVEVDDGVLEEQFNDLDETLWTPAERTLWETRMGNVLAIDLPTVINAGDKLVAYFCGALVGRPNQRERWLRGN